MALLSLERLPATRALPPARVAFRRLRDDVLQMCETAGRLSGLRVLRPFIGRLIAIIARLLAVALFVVVAPAACLFLTIFAEALVVTACDLVPAVATGATAALDALASWPGNWVGDWAGDWASPHWASHWGSAIAGLRERRDQPPGSPADDALVVGAALFGIGLVGLVMAVVMCRCGREF